MNSSYRCHPSEWGLRPRPEFAFFGRCLRAILKARDAPFGRLRDRDIIKNGRILSDLLHRLRHTLRLIDMGIRRRAWVRPRRALGK